MKFRLLERTYLKTHEKRTQTFISCSENNDCLISNLLRLYNLFISFYKDIYLKYYLPVTQYYI